MTVTVKKPGFSVAESKAIAKGRVAYKRGDYVTLNQLHDELDTTRRPASKKSPRKVS
jgi:hypothetical protein